jgi:hypothetical protein
MRGVVPRNTGTKLAETAPGALTPRLLDGSRNVVKDIV